MKKSFEELYADLMTAHERNLIFVHPHTNENEFRITFSSLTPIATQRALILHIKTNYRAKIERTPTSYKNARDEYTITRS